MRLVFFSSSGKNEGLRAILVSRSTGEAALNPAPAAISMSVPSMRHLRGHVEPAAKPRSDGPRNSLFGASVAGHIFW